MASIAMGDVFIFDFGSKDSPLREGATCVTEDGGELATWNKKDGLKSYNNKIITEWIENKSRGRKMPPVVYQNELTCDYVASSQPHTLTLNVPKGNYEVILLCGRAGKGSSQVWDINVTDGSTEESATIAGQYELRKLQFITTATDKGIELQLSSRSRWLINAMILIPEADRTSAQAQIIEPIMKECFMLPPEEMKKWQERPKPCTVPEPKWTEKQKKDGLAIFSRPWNDPVWPKHFPQQHELDAPVRAFASQNEYEPLTFTLHPLEDFANVSVNVGELINKTGDREFHISKENIDLRFVRYMYVRPNYSTYNTYYRAPDVLMPWREQSLEKGTEPAHLDYSQNRHISTGGHI